MKTFKLAAAATAFDPDLRKATREARQAGFAGLQINAFSSSLDITTLSTTGQREYLSILRASDLQLASLSVDLGAKGFSPGADIDAIIDKLDSVLQAAAGLSSPLLCIEIGPLPSSPAEDKPKPTIAPKQAGLIIIPALTVTIAPPEPVEPIDLPFVASVDSALGELARRADRTGISIAFRSELAGYASLDRALRTASCPWFGIDLEPIAILRDRWTQDEIFSRLGNAIRHVRGRDAILGTSNRTKPTMIGRGSVDWATLLRNLDDAGYKSWITLDPFDLPDRKMALSQGSAYLRRVVG